MSRLPVLMLSRLHTAAEKPLTLAAFKLNYEQLPSEAKQIRRWRKVSRYGRRPRS